MGKRKDKQRDSSQTAEETVESSKRKFSNILQKKVNL